MLFQRRFHAGIRDGSITLTFRTWTAPKVRAGESYRLGPEEAVRVRTIASVALSSITGAQAKRSGFADRDELIEVLRKTGKRRLDSRSKVVRVEFVHEHSRDPRVARRSDTSSASLDAVTARLERMDRLSRRGAWTRTVLRLIEKHPRVAASVLAPRVERETRAFKADVRKLKELGLTVSHEIGYSLSPRGKKLLARGERR